MAVEYYVYAAEYPYREHQWMRMIGPKHTSGIPVTRETAISWVKTRAKHDKVSKYKVVKIERKETVIYSN